MVLCFIKVNLRMYLRSAPYVARFLLDFRLCFYENSKVKSLPILLGCFTLILIT